MASDQQELQKTNVSEGGGQSKNPTKCKNMSDEASDTSNRETNSGNITYQHLGARPKELQAGSSGKHGASANGRPYYCRQRHTSHNHKDRDIRDKTAVNGDHANREVPNEVKDATSGSNGGISRTRWYQRQHRRRHNSDKHFNSDNALKSASKTDSPNMAASQTDSHNSVARPNEVQTMNIYNVRFKRRNSVNSAMSIPQKPKTTYQRFERDITHSKVTMKSKDKSVETMNTKEGVSLNLNTTKHTKGHTMSSSSKLKDEKHTDERNINVAADEIKSKEIMQPRTTVSFNGNTNNTKTQIKSNLKINKVNKQQNYVLNNREKQSKHNTIENVMLPVNNQSAEKENRHTVERPNVRIKAGQTADALGERTNISYNDKAKVTDVYVVMGSEISETSNLKNFLLHRIGNPKTLDFDLISNPDNKHNKNHVLIIRFKSIRKATIARQMLQNGNKHSSNKVQCFFDRAQAEGEVVNTKEQRGYELEKVFEQIVEKAEEVIGRHDAKLVNIRASLINIDNQLRKQRGIALSLYDKLSNERHAFSDKIEELERQRTEFTRYIQSMKRKLKEHITCNKFGNELKDIRKAFGVECHRLAAALPMYARREDILSIVRDNQVCVLLGETGSGKSTQVVQYLYQAGFAAHGMIACTQPRKIAAISLATHVAAELASSVGQVIGYKVGMQTKTTAVTEVVFMTDHILLNECLIDHMLTKYSCILIDEAHERSIHTDLLLGMLKETLGKRPELKVIITSATIDPDIFVEYFGGKERCPVLMVSGRAFPVDVFWEHGHTYDSTFPEGYEEKALNKAIEIHKTTTVEEGDILVFLTSAIETEKCAEKMNNHVGQHEVQCLQLHGKLKPEEQQLVFEKTPRGKRKVVFATNSAETSITIPGIKFVIDTGVVKEMRFDPKKNMNSLDVVSVSQSSANQRKGRAGRTSSGACYRLYTESNYKQMEKASTPEILRIQVAQALLKLMELSVDPMNFDYVQSPSHEAMQSALCELKDIGAVNDTGISELGKWIAKLPVDPRLGVFIKKGIDTGITIEALVVASCCNQSGIFFRVGSLDAKKLADMKKMKFCHLGGDLLTMLTVYREWDKVHEKAKGKWCQSNSINAKSMRGVRDIVNEIITTLKKELSLKIKHEFRSAEEADQIVQNLVFECMTQNLGYYLGHESAGYLIVNRKQRVKIHPSSAVLSLGYQPEWVVFNRVLKTSDDFITEVTPVACTVVEEAIKEMKINVNVTALENQKVNRVLKMPVGKHVYWKFVGPMHSNRRKAENEIAMTCDDSLIIVEANKQRGEISLFCLPEYEDQASAILRSILDTLPQQLLNESREESIGNDLSGVRAVLREGGSAVDILMPNEYRSLNIKLNGFSTADDIDEESAREVFEWYGPVEQIWRPPWKNQAQFWGKVTYTNEADAVTAAKNIDEDGGGMILVPITYANQRSAEQQGYTMQITWCRRPSKGHCFVYLDRPEDISSLLVSSPNINGARVDVMPASQQSHLYMKGLSKDVTEDQIKKGLADELGVALNACRDRIRVIIPRINVEWSVNQRLHVQEKLGTIISNYAARDSFRVHVREYRQQTVVCMAFVTFSDPHICYDTANEMIDDEPELNGNELNVSLECKSTVHVNKRLYDVVGKDIERLVDRYVHSHSTTSLEIRQLRSGHFSVDIKAVTPQKLAKVKVRVDRVIGGDAFQCGDKENLHVLFTKDGRNAARRIEKTTHTLVFVDERQMKVTIQGLVQQRIRAIGMVDDYISNHTSFLETEIRLKGEDNPPGLLKALLLKYGIRFEELKSDTGISGVHLNMRSHEITITGTEENMKNALKKIKELREGIAKRDNVLISATELPDCPICLCPVEESDMCRLEYCGHAYCKVCLTSQIHNAISERQLPVVCATEFCSKPLVIRDINSQIKSGNINRKALLDAAVGCLVSTKGEEFHFCITPDCEIVYRATSNGESFICPMCHSKLCTSCHSPSHDGLTCSMYKDASNCGGSIVKWMKEDPDNRKICPKCGFGIEKTEGCNNMLCKCGAHICWKCLKHFETDQACYGHLKDKHGSFY